MKQYRMFELSFSGPVLADHWAQPDLSAVFICEDEQVNVKGFYDGEGIYKVRFLPRKTGVWKWEVRGIVNASGEEICVPDETAHGMVKACKTHFVFEDGSKYIPVGTTIYALTHQTDAIVEQTFASLKAAPFNKVRMCVFPKDYDLIHGEPPFHPLHMQDGKPNASQPNISFWHRFESHLDRLEELGIQVDLILFHPYDCWGYSKMDQSDNMIYLDTVIRRLAARPNIWWSMANEYDVLSDWDLPKWYAIEAYIAENDPYGHLLSNHNCTAAYDFTRPNITHVCLQTRWVEKTADWVREYGKPVVLDEMCYEGNVPFVWGSITGMEMVHRFWTVCTNGGYGTHGDTFMDENSIIWWACGGTMKGESAPRIGFLKSILYGLPGPLEPRSQRGIWDLANTTDEEAAQKLTDFPGLACMVRGLHRMEPGLRQALITSETLAQGQCGDDAFLIYCGRYCPSQSQILLPTDHTYTIELIDAWNMTRQPVMTGVSGSVTVPLPSRECMAILATREH